MHKKCVYVYLKFLILTIYVCVCVCVHIAVLRVEDQCFYHKHFPIALALQLNLIFFSTLIIWSLTLRPLFSLWKMYSDNALCLIYKLLESSPSVTEFLSCYFFYSLGILGTLENTAGMEITEFVA